MTIVNTSPLFRDTLCFVSQLLYVLFIIDALLMIRQKNKIKLCICSFFFFVSYFIHQIFKEVVRYKTVGTNISGIESFTSISIQVYVWILFCLFVVGFIVLYKSLKWRESHISSASIKESIDYLPSGLAIYRNDGSGVLVNNKMNQLSVQLTGQSFLNGNELYEEVQKHEMVVDFEGKKYMFHQREFEYEQELLYELIADDITELFDKAQQLRLGNAQLEKMAEKMKQYGLTIDDTVRNQEILQAKIQIHDEMNRLLLATGNAASNGVSQEELNTILRTWQNNALLLCMEADEKPKNNTIQDMDTLAKLIGIHVKWQGSLDVENSECLKLFERITKEAMANAVKHARAKEMIVTMKREKNCLWIQYSNDGISPSQKIRESGGLKNIRNLIEQHQGSMEVISEPNFILKICIPLGGKEYGL